MGAAKEYAKAASLGESAAISAENIRLQAQRKAGGLLTRVDAGAAWSTIIFPSVATAAADICCKVEWFIRW